MVEQTAYDKLIELLESGKDADFILEFHPDIAATLNVDYGDLTSLRNFLDIYDPETEDYRNRRLQIRDQAE